MKGTRSETEVARKMLVGRVLRIFEDPISRENLEGHARIVKVFNYDSGAGSHYGLADCEVQFLFEPETFRRQIRFDDKSEEAKP